MSVAARDHSQRAIHARCLGRGSASDSAASLSATKNASGLDDVLIPPAASYDTSGVLNHARVSAHIDDGVYRRQPPGVGVFADQIIHSANFALPRLVFTWAAHSGNVSEP